MEKKKSHYYDDINVCKCHEITRRKSTSILISGLSIDFYFHFISIAQKFVVINLSRHFQSARIFLVGTLPTSLLINLLQCAYVYLHKYGILFFSLSIDVNFRHVLSI